MALTVHKPSATTLQSELLALARAQDATIARLRAILHAQSHTRAQTENGRTAEDEDTLDELGDMAAKTCAELYQGSGVLVSALERDALASPSRFLSSMLPTS